MGDQWEHTLKFKHLLKCSIKRDGIISIWNWKFVFYSSLSSRLFYDCKFCINKRYHCILILISIIRYSGTQKSRWDHFPCQFSIRMTIYSIYCTPTQIPSIEYLICQIPVMEWKFMLTESFSLYVSCGQVFCLFFICLGFFLNSYLKSSRWEVPLVFVLWMTRTGKSQAHGTISLWKRILAKVLLKIVTFYVLLFYWMFFPLFSWLPVF